MTIPKIVARNFAKEKQTRWTFLAKGRRHGRSCEQFVCCVVLVVLLFVVVEGVLDWALLLEFPEELLLVDGFCVEVTATSVETLDDSGDNGMLLAAMDMTREQVWRASGDSNEGERNLSQDNVKSEVLSSAQPIDWVVSQADRS